MGVTSLSVDSLIRNCTHKIQSLPAKTEAITRTVHAHLHEGRFREAVSLVFSSPTPFPFFLYAHLFQICSSDLTVVEARKVESHLRTYCPHPPTFLLNRAIETYGKCSSLDDARNVFEEMPQRDGGSWNAMITAYAQGGYPKRALSVFFLMWGYAIPLNEITLASVLASCASLLSLSLSRLIHGLIIRLGFCGNVILESSLVDIYGKCNIMGDSRGMFEEIENPNPISWNVIVRRYLEAGYFKEAVMMFFKMFSTGVSVTPLNFTFSNALVACSSLSAYKEGSQIHGLALKRGFGEDGVVSSSLIDMYVKCLDLKTAFSVFEKCGSENMVSWTSVVSGYAMIGRIREAKDLFDKMPNKCLASWNAMLAGYLRFARYDEALCFVFQMLEENRSLDNVTLCLVLNICAGLSNVQLGKQAHGYVYRNWFFDDLPIGNALLDMYGKCGDLRNVTLWFYEMDSYRDIVSWNSLLSTCVRHGLSEKVLSIFSELLYETTPSKFTFSTLLSACSNIFALEEGRQIHGFMVRNNYEMDVFISGSLVDMYSKCRIIEYALKVFLLATSWDVILCNSVILGCCHNRRGTEVIEVFKMMRRRSVSPDHVTFRGLLIACKFEGLVELGTRYFNSMSKKYSVIPRLEHYEGMIELYSSHGFVNELEGFVKNMPFIPTIPMLKRVLDASRKHGHLELAWWAADQLSLSHT